MLGTLRQRNNLHTFFSGTLRKPPIAIVGAGQAGLQLAIGLKKCGFPVSLYTNRTVEQLLSGKILSSQGMFYEALRLERRLGLNFWDEKCPQNNSVTFTLATRTSPAKPAIVWQGATNKPYQSIDQRLKFSQWLMEFEHFGGHISIQDVGLTQLNRIAREHALTVVAGGKGEISQSFVRDNVHSHFDKPQRTLACLYVKGVIPANGLQGVRANIIPGVGEFFIMPGLTINGACEMMLFEGIPGGAFDCWRGITDPQQQLEKALSLLKKFVPWEAERCANAKLTDQEATLTGSYTPIVRHPTFKLPCGKSVLGIGDTVVLNDPIAGQGANNASKAAFLYMNRILECSNTKASFDEQWMQKTFEVYWQNVGKWATKWSHLMLMPPAPHVIDLLNAASSYPTIANKLANGFDDPSTLFPWISHPDDTQQLISGVKQGEQSAQSIPKESQPKLTLSI